MIEYDLVKKEADPLNLNLIDFVFPQGRRQAVEKFCKRQRSIPPYERRRPIEPRIRIDAHILPQIEIMPPTRRYNRNNQAQLLKLFLRRKIKSRGRMDDKTTVDKTDHRHAMP